MLKETVRRAGDGWEWILEEYQIEAGRRLEKKSDKPGETTRRIAELNDLGWRCMCRVIGDEEVALLERRPQSF